MLNCFNKKTYLIDGFPKPDREGLKTETAALLKTLVERRELEDRVDVSILVEHEREDGQVGVDGRVTEHEVSIVDWDSNEVEHYGEKSLDDGDDETSVEHELSQYCGASVRKSSVPQDEFLELLELSE